MAATAVWGLDIGQCALKAVKATLSGNLVEVLAFDHIKYREPLSAGGDSTTAVREALQTFLSRNDIENCDFSVAIAAGRSALIRFIKLPPVDRKKVPDIVRYEATQQIPFPLEDVIWDYQVIERQYAPGEELEVGLFAMRREAIFTFLSNLMAAGIEVGTMQLAAAGIYNCVRYDQPVEEGAIMAVDIGAENTNLVVVDGNDVWTRSLPIGGNDFTRAIATKYGLEFEQAETLKHSMHRSKKAQEIFDALRPSLRSLLDEVQRSAGYYRSLHKSTKFVKLIGFGNGFKMYGVKRFLEAGLAYPVEEYSQTNNIIVANAVNAQFFEKSAPAFGAAMGLVVQALGFGGLNINLMPPQILRERMLRSKRPMLIAAAAMLAGAFVFYAAFAFMEPTAYGINSDLRVQQVKKVAQARDRYDDLTNVEKVENELQALVGLKASRADALDAFDALIKSLPQDEEYPIYINTIRMEQGGAKTLNSMLRTPWKGSSGTSPMDVVADTVARANYIKAAKEAMSRRRTSRTSGRLSRRDREQLALEHEAEAMARYERQEAELFARREARQREIEAQRRSGGSGAAADRGADVKRKKKGLTFTGAAFLAEITIETANPKGPAYIKTICKKMEKAVPGVLYCNYYFAVKETYWEHVKTHAREMTEPRGSNLEYEEKQYTTAVIQWLYKQPGSVIQVAEESAS
ncbi:MAG: type IV pilus assembly protein PilM [Planctomycetes bacterium]|nr:type IV pilus assembly protein PilM [Planctomycetota bacterium]